MPQPDPPPQAPSSAEESSLLQQVLAAVAAFLTTARDAVLGGRGEAPDLDQWPGPDVWLSAVSSTIRPAVADIFHTGFRHAMPADVDISDESWIHDYLDTLPNRLSGFDDDAYELVRGVIHDGLDDGATPAELRGMVAELLDLDRNREDWEWRAERIARTEAGIAAQGGRFSAASARSEATGQPTRVQWWTSMDSRVRPTHRAVHGDVVPLGESFAVGTSRLRFPCDPTGPPSEIAQCRCQLLVVGPGDEPIPADVRPLDYQET